MCTNMLINTTTLCTTRSAHYYTAGRGTIQHVHLSGNSSVAYKLYWVAGLNFYTKINLLKSRKNQSKNCTQISTLNFCPALHIIQLHISLKY